MINGPIPFILPSAKLICSVLGSGIPAESFSTLAEQNMSSWPLEDSSRATVRDHLGEFLWSLSKVSDLQITSRCASQRFGLSKTISQGVSSCVVVTDRPIASGTSVRVVCLRT